MLRGDGNLNIDIAVSNDDKAPQDQCGVFGVWAPGEEVAKLTFFGLYSLQHRGQESAGIATSDGKKILVYKDMGLVSQVFSESALESLVGHIAVGHNRYSTTGASHWRNAQPTLGRTSSGTVALAHNSNHCTKPRAIGNQVGNHWLGGALISRNTQTQTSRNNHTDNCPSKEERQELW